MKMEIEHMHFPENAAQIIGYALFALALIYLLSFTFIEGKSIISGLKGKDNAWQFIEIMAFVWIILFAAAAISDIFLGFHASGNLWASMDAIFIALVGGKIGLEHIKKPSNTPNKEQKSTEG